MSTPFGEGAVVEIRPDGVVVVSPDSWLLAHGKAPIFYLNPKDVSSVSCTIISSSYLPLSMNAYSVLLQSGQMLQHLLVLEL